MPARSALFPYTTLFRSAGALAAVRPPQFARSAAKSAVLCPVFGRNKALGVQPPREDSPRSEEHTSELQSRLHLVCRLLLEKKNDCAVFTYDAQLIVCQD